jgi:hypothetical protein
MWLADRAAKPAAIARCTIFALAPGASSLVRANASPNFVHDQNEILRL